MRPLTVSAAGPLLPPPSVCSLQPTLCLLVQLENVFVISDPWLVVSQHFLSPFTLTLCHMPLTRCRWLTLMSGGRRWSRAVRRGPTAHCSPQVRDCCRLLHGSSLVLHLHCHMIVMLARLAMHTGGWPVAAHRNHHPDRRALLLTSCISVRMCHVVPLAHHATSLPCRLGMQELTQLHAPRFQRRPGPLRCPGAGHLNGGAAPQQAGGCSRQRQRCHGNSQDARAGSARINGCGPLRWRC